MDDSEPPDADPSLPPAADDGPSPAGTGPSPAGVGEPEAVNAAVDADTGEGELERTIGLVGGLAIGVGTMIGAGIFVFPGLAAENAGPAASLSFAIGAVVALLVALPASELATAMPRSGGGYFFISRGLGTGPGAIVGIGLWLGLVFAAAFYLVGLGSYAGQVFLEAGITPPTEPEGDGGAPGRREPPLEARLSCVASSAEKVERGGEYEAEPEHAHAYRARPAHEPTSPLTLSYPVLCLTQTPHTK